MTPHLIAQKTFGRIYPDLPGFGRNGFGNEPQRRRGAEKDTRLLLNLSSNGTQWLPIPLAPFNESPCNDLTGAPRLCNESRFNDLTSDSSTSFTRASSRGPWDICGGILEFLRSDGSHSLRMTRE